LHSKYDSNEGLELETQKNANKQKEVVLTYFQLNASDKKPITVKKLVDTSNSNSAIVKALIEKEILRIIIYKRTVLILREN
jgi:primosomal protein N' (replication factor Y)